METTNTTYIVGERDIVIEIKRANNSVCMISATNGVYMLDSRILLIDIFELSREVILQLQGAKHLVLRRIYTLEHTSPRNHEEQDELDAWNSLIKHPDWTSWDEIEKLCAKALEMMDLEEEYE